VSAVRCLLVLLMLAPAFARAAGVLADAPVAALLGPSNRPLVGDEMMALERGKILSELLPEDGKGARLGVAIAVVAAPPSAVAATLRDYAHYQEFMPKVARVDVLSHLGEHYLIRVTVKAGAGLGDREYEQRVSEEKAKIGQTQVLVGRFEYTGKGNIGSSVGRWLLVPIAGGVKTLVRYEVRFDPGGSIPTLIKNRALKDALDDTVDAVRKRTMR
jgi:hypothetical protein